MCGVIPIRPKKAEQEQEDEDNKLKNEQSGRTQTVPSSHGCCCQAVAAP